MVDWMISKAGEEAPVVLTTVCEADFTGWRQTGSVQTLTRVMWPQVKWSTSWSLDLTQ